MTLRTLFPFILTVQITGADWTTIRASSSMWAASGPVQFNGGPKAISCSQTGQLNSHFEFDSRNNGALSLSFHGTDIDLSGYAYSGSPPSVVLDGQQVDTSFMSSPRVCAFNIGSSLNANRMHNISIFNSYYFDVYAVRIFSDTENSVQRPSPSQPPIETLSSTPSQSKSQVTAATLHTTNTSSAILSAPTTLSTSTTRSTSSAPTPDPTSATSTSSSSPSATISPSPSGSKRPQAIAVGILVPGIVIGLIVAAAVFFLRRRRQSRGVQAFPIFPNSPLDTPSLTSSAPLSSSAAHISIVDSENRLLRKAVNELQGRVAMLEADGPPLPSYSQAEQSTTD